MSVRQEIAGFVSILRDSWIVAKKDLRVELRSKEILLTTAYFGFLVVLVFSFSFFYGDAPLHAVAAGILWVAVAFAGTLGLGRVFEREREGDCIRALLLTPIARPALFLGKALGVFVFMLVVEAVVVPALFFFFNLAITAERAGMLALVLLLGTIGYSVIGTLLASMLLRAQTKDVLLTIVLYPFILPLLILGVKATAALFDLTGELGVFSECVRLLVAFDVVFLVASLWTFEPILVD
ncbi:MAG: heme exporter protein CcmB [Deltaproteobacteria bacterium]|nr:heme exporter protein CcmB [Deltaproteobacteria bacterium]